MNRLTRGALAGAANGAILAVCVSAFAPERWTELSCGLVVGAAMVLAATEASLQARDDRFADAPLARASGLSLLALLLCSALWTGRDAAPLVGLALMLLGVALRASAMHALADDFVSDAYPARRLIMHGVYRWLRHPSETGLLCFALGAAVTSGATLGLVLLLLLTGLSIARVEREEIGLRATFGPSYASYARRVPALVGLAIPGASDR